MDGFDGGEGVEVVERGEEAALGAGRRGSGGGSGPGFGDAEAEVVAGDVFDRVGFVEDDGVVLGR